MSTASASRALTFARSGKDGKTGDYTETRYAVNAMADRAPTLNPTTRSPAGWSIVQPVAGEGTYVWMTSAKINGETEALLTRWNIPVRITSTDGVDGKDGTDGADGTRGPALRGPQYWEDCPGGYLFQSGADGEQWVDVVIYNEQYYICKSSHRKFTSCYPGSDADQSIGYWQLGDKVDMVATKVLLAEYSVIKNLGAEAIEMRDADGNVVFEAKDGNVTCQTGTFNNVKVESGQVAGFNIVGEDLTNEGFNTDARLIARNDAKGAFAAVGANVLPIASGFGVGARAMARFENTETGGDNATNYAAILVAQGKQKNVALHIDGGCIQGLAMSNQIISTATTLNRTVNNVICIGADTYKVTLPVMQLHDDGHMVRIKSLKTSGNLQIAASNCYTYNGTVGRLSRPVIIYDRALYITGTEYLTESVPGIAMEFIWVRDFAVTISGNTYYGAWVQYKFPRDW